MQAYLQQPPVTIIRLKEVINRTGLPRASVYEKIKNCELTKPIPLGARRVGWPAYEIDELNKAVISGANEPAIKRLVNELTNARQSLFKGV